jgi:hypothetical protein
MSYADSLGVLKTISQDKYIGAIRDGIDALGAKMETAGYNPTDIRRYFRMVLAKLAGPRLADYCWDFFVWSRANMLFRYAEENFDRKYPNSLGLLWTITIDPDEGIDRCRWDVNYLEHGTATEEHLEEARQKEEALRQKFLREHGGLTILLDDSLRK